MSEAPAARPPIRSFLFVPADSERKYVKAAGTKSDALILDLEDSVAQENLPKAFFRFNRVKFVIAQCFNLLSVAYY